MATTINALTLDASPDAGDEVEIQKAGGGPSRKVTITSLNGVGISLDALTDVTITSVADLNLLQFDNASGLWINRPPDAAGILDKTTTQTATGEKAFTNAVLTTSKVDSTPIGQTTAAAGAFTVLTATTIDGNLGSITPAPAAVTALTATTLVNVATDLTLTAGSILSASGAITFGNENLSTTGTLSCGDITSTGNLVIATSGKGIDFGTSVLDDYEEGTWTPVLTFGGASVGITYSAQLGTYTKVGNRVMVDIRLALTSKGSSTGAIAITGLPFTADNTTATYGCPSFLFIGVTFTGSPAGAVGPGATSLQMYDNTNAGLLSSMNEGNVSDTSQIRITVTYQAA